MFSWYLIHSKPMQEALALNKLQRQGFECYLPLVSVKNLQSKLLMPVDEPLFPRYFFIRLDASQQGKSWNSIRYTAGVSRLVSFGNVPAKVDDALVLTIQSHLQALSLEQAHVAPGEQLRITQGPFAGLEAVYQMGNGIARVMVLIEIISKQVRLSIEPGSLSKQA
jgi:transcriptional antiterminator RfaH